MTETEKKKITTLRQEGLGYKKISLILGISRDSVRSFVKRNPVDVIKNSKSECRQCGRRILSAIGRKQRLFCSDECRSRWWNSHRELIAYGYKSVCEYCGRTFAADRKSKFCSQECYHRNRFHRSSI